MTATTPKPPRVNLTNVPRMVRGMGKEAAYLNGYRHGYERVNTIHSCTLERGTEERNEWMRGYFDASSDKDGR
jgi:hypothetical protein